MTTRQRAALRAMCNALEPVLQIGKDGVTDNLVKQCWDALEARELIKVNVQKNAPFANAREACEALCDLPAGARKLQNPSRGSLIAGAAARCRRAT